MSLVADAISGSLASVGIPVRVAVVYVTNQTIILVVYRVLKNNIVNVERSGWDNTVYPIIFGGPISLVTGMVTSYFLRKVMGDPVGAKYIGLMLLFSFVGLVVGNVLINKVSPPVKEPTNSKQFVYTKSET